MFGCTDVRQLAQQQGTLPAKGKEISPIGRAALKSAVAAPERLSVIPRILLLRWLLRGVAKGKADRLPLEHLHMQAEQLATVTRQCCLRLWVSMGPAHLCRRHTSPPCQGVVLGSPAWRVMPATAPDELVMVQCASMP